MKTLFECVWTHSHRFSISDEVFSGRLRSWSWSFPLELIDCGLTSIELAHLVILQISNEDGDQCTDQAVGGSQHAEDDCEFSVEVAVATNIELVEITGRHDDAVEGGVDD